MKKIFTILTLICCLVMASSTVFAASAATRIKDIAKVQGVRNNQLLGYGLVVGLQGTGDSDDIGQMISSTISMLKSFGITVSADDLDSTNVAAVIVTATLPPFVREGDTIDVTISSMGDAKSIQGGTLIQTPLRAANGEVYAVAQGPVSTGGFVTGNGTGGRSQRNFPTVGTTPNGAIVERTVEDDIGSKGQISLSLSEMDFTTANRVANAINSAYFPLSIARAANPGRVDVSIPINYRNNVVGFISSIERLSIVPDNVAKVVFNERTGTIVMGGEVSVDECAITQGGLSIRVTSNTNVYQPFSYGRSIVTRNTDEEVQEQESNTIVMPPTTNVNDIVGALNAVGATPRDCISILQALKAAGAIHADLEII